MTQLLALMTSEGTWRKKLADLTIKWVFTFFMLWSISFDAYERLASYHDHRWSSEFGDCQTGDPDLHKYIGELYYKGKFTSLLLSAGLSDIHPCAVILDRKFVQAEQHLVASCKRDAALTLAEMAYEWQVSRKA